LKLIVDGIQYHVEISGDGFPLVLLHGFTGDGTTWAPFHQDWGQHSRLIIPDIIGHGKTDAPDDLNRYQIESVAADMVNILDQLEVKQVDILGYSMGGRLALTIAILYPERVRKLILESASPGLPTEEERRDRRKKDGELAKLINEQGILSFVDFWENIPLFSTMNALPESVKEKIRKQRLSNSQRGLANSLLGMGTGSQPSWWNDLHKLSGEVLLLTGEKDKKFILIAEKIQKNCRDASLIVFNETGHAIHVEELEKFGTIVSDFLMK
jgi:2-succinyl-6-hydroxy-2,4-cyclohexadiene-1-carboxylate synthase